MTTVFEDLVASMSLSAFIDLLGNLGIAVTRLGESVVTEAVHLAGE